MAVPRRQRPVESATASWMGRSVGSAAAAVLGAGAAADSGSGAPVEGVPAGAVPFDLEPLAAAPFATASFRADVAAASRAARADEPLSAGLAVRPRVAANDASRSDTSPTVSRCWCAPVCRAAPGCSGPVSEPASGLAAWLPAGAWSELAGLAPAWLMLGGSRLAYAPVEWLAPCLEPLEWSVSVELSVAAGCSVALGQSVPVECPGSAARRWSVRG